MPMVARAALIALLFAALFLPDRLRYWRRAQVFHCATNPSLLGGT